MMRKRNPLDAPRAAPPSREQFLAERQQTDVLRFIICGSVDDGERALIGRLLRQAQHRADDRHGATARRTLMATDMAGQAPYTHRMVTSAAAADLAIVFVDAGQGVPTRTRRHACLASLVGIKHVVLAVSKMERVDYRPDVFEAVVAAFAAFAEPLGFASVHAIPMSALGGDNLIDRSAHTAWYNGPTLMGLLDAIDVAKAVSRRFAFSVHDVRRPDASLRSVSGTVLEGQVKVGDQIRVAASGQTARVAQLVAMDGLRQQAAAGDAVTICLDREMAVSRGDVMALSCAPLDMTDRFEATLVWLHEDEGWSGRAYELQLDAQRTTATITAIAYRVEVDSPSQAAVHSLALNDIAVCTVVTAAPLAYDRYENSQALGSFILVDRFNHATLAVGMIRHTLRRAQNVYRQPLAIARPDRERLNGHCGQVVWFTGLSGSGKSTLANAMEVALHRRGRRTYILDGDNVRQGLNKDLGFTDADRVENIRRIAEVAKLMADAGLIVMTAFISPFIREREMAKALIGAERFVEVFVSTPLGVCESRDVKGLYRRARAGELPNMTGIGSPYEAPVAPAFSLSTGEMTAEETIEPLLALLLDDGG